MTEAVALPVPNASPTSETQEFWDGLKQSKFMLRQCNNCQVPIWYPRAICPTCGTMDTSWVEASGKGTIYTYTVTNRTGMPGWAEASPYVIAYVELEEGPRILTNIVNCELDAVAVGLPVRVVYVANDEGSVLYRFEPDTAS
jgi:uncharacterized OB-fold protein